MAADEPLSLSVIGILAGLSAASAGNSTAYPG
jgi:hypothetical protein